MKTMVRNIGIAERRVIDAVLNEIPPSKTNRALVRNIRAKFNIGNLRHEVNALRSAAIQEAMDKNISENLVKVLTAKLEGVEIPLTGETHDLISDTVERVVRTVAGPGLLQSVTLSWEELIESTSYADYEVDKTDLKMFRKFYDAKEDWAWNDKKEVVPPPSALHEVLANLDDAIDEALKE